MSAMHRLHTSPPAHSAPAPASPPGLRLWQRALLWAGVLGVLLAVFAWYLQPAFMVSLADAVWACF